MRILTHLSPMHLNANYPLSHQWLANVRERIPTFGTYSGIFSLSAVATHVVTPTSTAKIRDTRRTKQGKISTKRTRANASEQAASNLILGTTRGLRLAANPQTAMRSAPLVFREDTGVGTSLF
jgi:hypothetical protein